jgi:hypothetical protein
MKSILEPIIALAAVIGIVVGGMAYFARASELKMVEMRLDQKIVGDQLYETQKAVRDLEERNLKNTSDCSKWPDARDRESYKKLKVQEEELQKKKDHLMRK